jgi:hypothetical protein
MPVVAFAIIGVYLAHTHGFERWAGHELSKAGPVARRVIPTPAKRVLRESREALPVYGSATTWLARKSASVAYFGLFSYFVLALRKRRPTSLGETLLVTVVAGIAMSALIELIEYPEEIADEIFDLSCGALGGLIAGALNWWIWARKGRLQGSPNSGQP